MKKKYILEGATSLPISELNMLSEVMVDNNYYVGCEIWFDGDINQIVTDNYDAAIAYHNMF